MSGGMVIKHNSFPRDISSLLTDIKNPGRYTGGEFGAVIKTSGVKLKVAISYPDLYEIGMSNGSIRILYSLLNSINGVACERVFAPDSDLENVLRSRQMPLFSLETATPLMEFDILGFSVGYELTITNLLNIIELGGVNLRNCDRDDDDPIVVAGGSAVINPAPIGDFVDCVFIGEAEDWIVNTFSLMAKMKTDGARRNDLLDFLFNRPSVWYGEKTTVTKRAVWKGFGAVTSKSFYPVPNIKTVQDHGVVEIMRGCPNGCRYCQAGYYYRPCRVKNPREILKEVAELVFSCGYREITMSSLSSGDYPGLDQVVEHLNQLYKGINISFALPSLKVNTLALSILKGLSEVRKSGLTFAVETPEVRWQKGINKIVTFERVVKLLAEAEKLGWSRVKFYFMIGLPVAGSEDESDQIISFMRKIQNETTMRLNINIACFIPKPHTPFQWESQISEEEGLKRIFTIKNELKGKRIKISYHAPFASTLEGVFSRGDRRAGDIAYRAFLKGARFDAWDDRIDRNLWRSVLRESNWDVAGEISRAKDTDEPLPWDNIDIGVSRRFLINELKRSKAAELTKTCSSICRDNCGVCKSGVRITKWDNKIDEHVQPIKMKTGETKKILFNISKTDSAIFYSHLNIMKIMERSMLRAGYYACFTGGYNPKPRIEFASPLSVGIASDEEVVCTEIFNFNERDTFIASMNNSFPPGLKMNGVKILKKPETGKKKRSLMSLFWGSDFFLNSEDQSELIREILSKLMGKRGNNGTADASESNTPIHSCSSVDKGILLKYRKIEKGGFGLLKVLTGLLGDDPFKMGIRIKRTATWATGKDGNPISYFDLLI